LLYSLQNVADGPRLIVLCLALIAQWRIWMLELNTSLEWWQKISMARASLWQPLNPLQLNILLVIILINKVW